MTACIDGLGLAELIVVSGSMLAVVLLCVGLLLVVLGYPKGDA